MLDPDLVDAGRRPSQVQRLHHVRRCIEVRRVQATM